MLFFLNVVLLESNSKRIQQSITTKIWTQQYVTFLLSQTFLSVPFPLILFLPQPSALQRVTTARLVWDLHTVWLPWDLLLGRGATALCSCREPRRQKQFGDHCWQWSWQTSSRSLWTTWPHLSREKRKFRLPTWSLSLEVDAGLSRGNSPASLQPGYALERGTSWLHPPLWAQVGEAP